VKRQPKRCEKETKKLFENQKNRFSPLTNRENGYMIVTSAKQLPFEEETIMNRHSFAVEYSFRFAYYFKGKACLSFTENGSYN